VAAKRFQVRTEEEIEQLIRNKSWKSTNKASQNAVKTLEEFCKEQNLPQSFEELNNTDLNSLLTYVSWICSILGTNVDPQRSPLEGLGETKLTVSLGGNH